MIFGKKKVKMTDSRGGTTPETMEKEILELADHLDRNGRYPAAATFM